MKPFSRLRKSRDSWREKAVKRGTSLRDLRKALNKARLRTETQQAEQGARIQLLEAENTALRSSASIPILARSHADRRILCVQLVIRGIVSFRSVPRILTVINDQ